MKLHEFPRYPLTFGPSPVHPLNRLSDHLGGPRIWAKREDVNSGLAFGGNKTRKLEYIVPDALDQGADTLVSIGGVQSNHTRQVAAVAAHLGLKCRLVQERWVDWDDPVNDRVGNILLSRIMGADVRLDASGFDIGIRRSWEEALAAVEKIVDGVVDGDVLLVSHGAAVRLAAAALLGETAETFYVPNTGLVVLRQEADGWALESWDTAEPIRGDVTAGGTPA